MFTKSVTIKIISKVRGTMSDLIDEHLGTNVSIYSLFHYTIAKPEVHILVYLKWLEILEMAHSKNTDFSQKQFCFLCETVTINWIKLNKTVHLFTIGSGFIVYIFCLSLLECKTINKWRHFTDTSFKNTNVLTGIFLYTHCARLIILIKYNLQVDYHFV